MGLLLSVVLCFMAVALVTVLFFNITLKRKLAETSSEIESISSYYCIKQYPDNGLSRNNNIYFTDFESDLNLCFNGKYISFREIQLYSEYYSPIFNRLLSFLRQHKMFHIAPTQPVIHFVEDFQNIPNIVKNTTSSILQMSCKPTLIISIHALNIP